jgi:hypothetical protein
MKNQVLSVKIFKVIFLLLISILSLNITGCTSTIDPNTSMTRFSLKGNEKKEVNLYGQKYIFEITKIEDNRCFNYYLGYGLWGMKVAISLKSSNLLSENKTIELFSHNCESRDLKDTVTYFDKAKANPELETVQDINGFKIGLFNATPNQVLGPQTKKYLISDYEIILITQKQ